MLTLLETTPITGEIDCPNYEATVWVLTSDGGLYVRPLVMPAYIKGQNSGKMIIPNNHQVERILSMAEVSPSLSGELPVEASAIVHNYVSLEGLDENEVLISIDGVNSETVDYMKELVWANVSCDADKSYKLQTSITPRPSSL